MIYYILLLLLAISAGILWGIIHVVTVDNTSQGRKVSGVSVPVDPLVPLLSSTAGEVTSHASGQSDLEAVLTVEYGRVQGLDLDATAAQVQCLHHALCLAGQQRLVRA